MSSFFNKKLFEYFLIRVLLFLEKYGIILWSNKWRDRTAYQFSVEIPTINMHSTHQGEIFRRWRRYPHPMPDKRACRSSGGVCEVDSDNELSEPHLIGLHKYDARCCIIFMERYRSGHNGADSKFCSHFGTSHLKSLDL